MDVDAPATQDLTQRPHLHRKRPKPCPAAAAPRTRRCPMPGADPQTETTAITQGHLHTMLNPGLQRRSLNTRVIRVTPEIWSCPRREHGSVRKGPANAGTSRHGLPNLWMPGPEDPLVVADDLYCPLRARTGDGQTLAADHDIGVNGRAVEPDLIPLLVAHRQTVDHREREALSHATWQAAFSSNSTLWKRRPAFAIRESRSTSETSPRLRAPSSVSS